MKIFLYIFLLINLKLLVLFFHADILKMEFKFIITKFILMSN